MSAPMKMTADQLHDLARALDDLTAVRQKYGVLVAVYGPVDVRVGPTVVSVSWDDDLEQYIVDDRNGS